MSINITAINGHNPLFDYEAFETSLNQLVSGTALDAQVFAFNNFPVPVSSEANIDLLLVLAVNPEKGNYYRFKKKDRYVYLHNLIIPIKFVSHLKAAPVTISGLQLLHDGEVLDYSTEISSLRFNLTNYLVHKCGFQKDQLYVQPLIFIQNPHEQVLDNYLVAPQLDFFALNRYFLESTSDIFISYKEWKTDAGYAALPHQLHALAEQAIRDSEIGFLTRRKTERLGRQLTNEKTLFEELNKNLIIIHGKAGTGKSSELLTLMMKCTGNGGNALFLSYNKLLIFDIARTIKAHLNIQCLERGGSMPGEAAVLTLHSFFYRLARSLGVLHVLSAARLEKLQHHLKERMRLIYNFTEPLLHQPGGWASLKQALKATTALDAGAKEAGLDFIRFLERSEDFKPAHFNRLSKEYYERKVVLLSQVEASKTFIANYYEVLESTLLAISEPEAYFEQHGIAHKYSLLLWALHLQEHQVTRDEGGVKITPEGFTGQVSRILAGHRRNRTVFVDEAQDCHRFEKEILLSLYGASNLVVANGGKDQLVRHTELCNWEVSQNKKIAFRKYYTRNKSFRIRKTVADFCNFVAAKFNIDFHLEPTDAADDGELLIDFRQQNPDTAVKEVFNHLALKGAVNGCTRYESLLVLLESNSQRAADQGELQERPAVMLSEHGNIRETLHRRKGGWKYMPGLETYKDRFWDGTIDDKSQQALPGPHESRIIYYESCRGLESWSVACFALDKFFNQKLEEPDAARFLVEDLFLAPDVEKRKQMYAATWVLMALTRVIDTLYIQLNDRESVFGKVVAAYLALDPAHVRELGPHLVKQ